MQQIHHYYAPSFRPHVSDTTSIMWTPPTEVVEELNEQILKLRPAKTYMIMQISGIALSCIFGAVTGSTLFFLARRNPYLGLLGCVGYLFAATSITYKYFTDLDRPYLNIAHKIRDLPKKFYYHEDRLSNGNLSSQEFDQIKTYLPQDRIGKAGIQLPVRHQTLYEITGGEIGSYSIQQLHITPIEKCDNEQTVLQTYKPWIDLLLAIRKSGLVLREEKIEICEAIGQMIYQPTERDIHLIRARIRRIETTKQLFEGIRDLDKMKPCFAVNVDDRGQPYIVRYHAQQADSYFTAKEFADFLKQEYALNVAI